MSLFNFGQSDSPSQRHLAEMQLLSEHWNSLIGSHVVGWHAFSSELSPVADESICVILFQI